MAPTDRESLDHLFQFAGGILAARETVQMQMDAGLGVYHERDLAGMPGLALDCDDGAWLRLSRLKQSKPPAPPEHVGQFIAQSYDTPSRAPSLQSAIAREVTIEEASDLAEAGLLRPDAVSVVERGERQLTNIVHVVLFSDDLAEMRADFEAWRDGVWSDWAEAEKPVRRSIGCYNSIFQIAQAMHNAEGTPPELVWGIGIGRWQTARGPIDMPLIEQLVEIELEDDASLAIRPRDITPSLSLKPYLEAEIMGAPQLQGKLNTAFQTLLDSTEQNAFSPFQPSGWDPVARAACNGLDSAARYIDRTAIEDGEALPRPSGILVVSSTWAIFGRPRSAEARRQDIEALRKKIADERIEIPKSLTGFVAVPPEVAPVAADAWGLNTTILADGGLTNGWTQSEGPLILGGVAPARNEIANSQTESRFFPLPSNDEQENIIRRLDQPETHVVTVTGPPGTGKTHTIANIISHYMATGRRVLVTARTAEAIAAARSKLPEELRSLVIASVGSDRDSAEQLREAIGRLSDEVMTLDSQAMQDQRLRLEGQISAAEQDIRDADAELTRIARANLAPLKWKGKDHSAMDLVRHLSREAVNFAWFTDRPGDRHPEQMRETVARLRGALPRIAPDLVYAGRKIPTADELPTTALLIEAWKQEAAEALREKPDYSTAPRMARDGSTSEAEAAKCLAEIHALTEKVSDFESWQAELMAHLAGKPGDPIDIKAVEKVADFLERFTQGAPAKDVYFDPGPVSDTDLLQAVSRGQAGQAPLPFGAALFNGGLKRALGSIRVAGRAPSDPSDWAKVWTWIKIRAERDKIETTLHPLEDRGFAPSLPTKPEAIAAYAERVAQQMRAARTLAIRASALKPRCLALFPIGLDFDACIRNHDFTPAAFALEANLPSTYRAPAVLQLLESLAGAQETPLERALLDLRSALSRAETDPNDILGARNAITAEIARISAASADVDRCHADLEELRGAGAKGWAESLLAAPEDAKRLMPENWSEAWTWAVMMGRVEAITALGNGDEVRRAKADAMKRRRQHMRDLIRTRTLLGLKGRLTGPVQTALLGFTQAVARIGKGTGKSAPRWRRAAQVAAKQAAGAAPVWIMPEYKIAEQLPADIATFDLVILDEASQSDITAVAALARGKKLLIVGDEEQVSPSNVGISSATVTALRAMHLSGLPNPDLVDENTSIFEIAMRMFPTTHLILREHFRCVAPIIAFSAQFYGGRLIPLRVPKASERFDPPLVDVYIKGGRRQGQVNRDEARFIVDEIAAIVADPAHANRSIGVISLIGREQAQHIERLLIEDERIGPEVIAERNIIAGDARTVQGQERSIVFLSMVADPSMPRAQSDKTTQQRFNVAMSRAADRLYLVRSVTRADLRDIDLKAKILDHFSQPMPDGHVVASDDILDRCESDFEREVLRRLLDAGYRARPQVAAGPFSIDIVVEGRDDRRLAIELDGDRYHPPEVWDRDMARQAALERAGWTFWRVFGSAWAAQTENYWQDLLKTLDTMGIAPIGQEAVSDIFTEVRIVDLAAEIAPASETDSEYSLNMDRRDDVRAESDSAPLDANGQTSFLM